MASVARREKTLKSLQLQLSPREEESSSPSLELIAYERLALRASLSVKRREVLV